MLTLVLADLRQSLRIWTGSVVILAVVQLCVMWTVGLMLVGVTNAGGAADGPAVGGVPAVMVKGLSQAIITVTGLSLLIVAIVASITVRNVVNSIVYQRRRVMALWQLAGMTDRQLLRILRAQVALLALAALALSVPTALLTAPALVELLRSMNLLISPPMTTEGLFLGYAIGAGIGVLLCVRAVRGVSKELRSISPLEAIRSEGVRELPMTLKRWLGLAVCTAMAATGVTSALHATKISDVMQSGLIVGLLGIVILTLGGPVLLIGLVRAWTALVPAHLSASWFLARSTLLAATARCVATVGSISLAVFLLTVQYSLQVFPAEEPTGPKADVEVDGFLLGVGFPLLISVTGSIVLVFMAGQQREREIHLAELAGATPAQQRRQALFEAVIVVATGSGIGLGATMVAVALLQPLLIATTGAGAFPLAWGPFAAITASLLVLNIVATVGPTMIAQAARERIAVPE